MRTKLKKETMKLINLRINPSEFAAIRKQAKKYAAGNVSLWLRYAGRNFKPKAQELK